MSDEAEYEYRNYGFPTRTATLERLLQEWRGKGDTEAEITLFVGGKAETVPHMSEADVKRLKEIIASANQLEENNSKLVEILSEEISGYLSGQITLEKTLENIQNRVSIYVNEEM